MKKIFPLLIAALLVAVATLVLFRSPRLFKSNKNTSKNSLQVVPPKSFVVIIPSYNNSAYCEHNLRSVLTQQYDHYRVIYIDDCSSDDTYEKVKALIASSKAESRVTLIHNDTNRGALYNLYHAIHSCHDHEIIVTVDGDDYLAHEKVLTTLNRLYANPDVWMTYGNYLDYPTYKQKPLICRKIPKKVVQKSSYRSYAWVSSHLRTFYAALFKQIKQEDLLYQGQFLKMGWDLAFMMPMLEMAGSRAHFVRDVLYLYNRQNPLNDHKVDIHLQNACANHIRLLPHYPRLSSFPSSSL